MKLPSTSFTASSSLDNAKGSLVIMKAKRRKERASDVVAGFMVEVIYMAKGSVFLCVHVLVWITSLFI